MPKVIYTPTKGLYQATGTGFEISGAAIVPASTVLEPGGPVYVLTLTVPGSPVPATDYVGNTITIARADGTEDTLLIGNGSGDIDSASWASTADAANGIGKAIAGLGASANTEFAYNISTVTATNDTITIYSLKAGESGADIAVAGGSNIAAATTTQGVSGEISGKNNLAVVADSDSDVAYTSLLNASGAQPTPPAGSLAGVTLANGSSVGQKVCVMNLSTNRQMQVDGVYYDSSDGSSDTKLYLAAGEIQQLIWNGSAWASALSSGSPSFAA